jgi:hypothetical protein
MGERSFRATRLVVVAVGVGFVIVGVLAAFVG